MLYSRTRGLPVVTLGEAAELGTVAALEVDAARGEVTAVRVSGRGRRTVAVPWSALHAVGADAVLVESDTVVDGGAKGRVPRVLGTRVLSEEGDEQGTVKDLVFDPATGRIEKVLTDLGEIPAGQVLGLGDHALVVRAD